MTGKIEFIMDDGRNVFDYIKEEAAKIQTDAIREIVRKEVEKTLPTGERLIKPKVTFPQLFKNLVKKKDLIYRLTEKEYEIIKNPELTSSWVFKTPSSLIDELKNIPGIVGIIGDDHQTIVLAPKREKIKEYPNKSICKKEYYNNGVVKPQFCKGDVYWYKIADHGQRLVKRGAQSIRMDKTFFNEHFEKLTK